MGANELRVEDNNTSAASGCSYTDGAQYVGCQVAAKGWPQPQNMGGGRGSRKCKRCKRKSCHCKKRKSSKKGGFLGKAAVPFGLLAALKHTQKKRATRKSKKFRKSKKSKKSRKSRK